MASISAGPLSDADGATWPAAYFRVIDGIACPAYCCSPEGAVVHCNRSARHLWGDGCASDEAGRWDGFAALYRLDGAPVEKSSSPAALAAASGVAPPPAEFIAESSDGQRRCLVIHAHPVLRGDGAIAGVLCSLTDVSERRRLDREIRFARDNREAFLRVLAHELRNPLASVMTAAALLRQPGIRETDRMARVIERQTRQLARFIRDLLDGARIEHACDIAVAMRSSSVGGVLELARDVVDDILRARGQTLCVDADAPDAVLWCDPERLAQALGNALLNASEFSDNGAEIFLAVAIDGALLEVQVADRGIGVEAAQLHTMFEPFRKFAAHPARAPSGAGLGLAIARSVCRAHDGMVSAHSAGPGQGTRLRFILPVVADAAPALADPSNG
jgi:signal transduction histidine kinase